jgi:poly(A) polymerase
MKRILKSIKAIFAPLGRKRGPAKPVILPRQKHSVSRKNIDPDALKILYRLKRFGHTAYLVGGSVRDLMLGIEAKDFDISTDARPMQMKKLFTNCRLVGKRFRLAHILFRGKFIEVATFRKQSEFDAEGDDLLIRSDNTFGTPLEDAFRRDFTVNALFYNIEDFSVIDYVGGLKDLEERVLRCIGDPNIRLREDPIRMLRAIRLASRLDFQIDPALQRAIAAHRGDIWKGATPRITEEIFRMMAGGTARRSFSLLMETGLMDLILPELTIVLVKRGQAHAFWAYLSALDKLTQGGKEFSQAVLYAALMIHLFHSKLEHTKGEIDRIALAEESITPIAQRLGIPKRVQDRARAILVTQRRFQSAVKREGGVAGGFQEKPYFQDSLDLFHIHAVANPEFLPVHERWRRLGHRPPSAPAAPPPPGPPQGEDAAAEPQKSRGRSRSRGRRRRPRTAAPE